MAVAVDHDDVARRDGGVPHHLVGRRGAVGDKEQMVAVENARRIALGRRHRAGVIEQLPQFVHRVADVGTQQVLAKKLVEHLADRRLQKGHAARVPRAVPGIRAVRSVVGQRTEKWRHQRIEIGTRFAQDVPRQKLRRVFQHVDEAVELAQDIVRNMARSTGFAMQKNRDFGIAEAHFFDKATQLLQRALRVLVAARQFFVVNRQHKGRCARLLLGKRSQVTIIGDAEHFDAFFFNRLGQGANTQSGGVLGTKIFVNDDNGKTKAHGVHLVEGR